MDQQRESKVNGEKVNSSKQNLFLGALRTKQERKLECQEKRLIKSTAAAFE